ncbi:MAG: hypothetical protein H0W84_10720, partial [Bacteroidetes bacterium]|nr:hypothetical protein [Bacteroidota bacterium]
VYRDWQLSFSLTLQNMYTLEPYKGPATRHSCPGCGKEKVFSRYIDKRTGKYILTDLGRCNREISCGYHKLPKSGLVDSSIRINTRLSLAKIDFIPLNQFQRSLKAYETNHFISFLICQFGKEAAMSLVIKYCIGTSRHWAGATIFWQLDHNQNVRTGKIMLYDPFTGKRVKNPHNHIHWVHKLLKKPEYALKQCLFGCHLINESPCKPIGIVESEKTAIIASALLPELTWLATGGLNNLNAENLEVLKNRKVFLFPDLNGFEKWILKAQSLQKVVSVIVSDFLEKNAKQSEKDLGLDICSR